jgi:hypothetical protein
MSGTNRSGLLETILNLARYHREHESFYAQAPLEQAIVLQEKSRVLKALAERWATVAATDSPAANPYAGCEDLNETAAIRTSGVIFMEGEPISLASATASSPTTGRRRRSAPSSHACSAGRSSSSNPSTSRPPR